VRIFAAWTLTAALLLVACGGNVVVDGSPGSTSPYAAGGSGAGTSSVGVGAGQGVSVGGAGGAAGGGGPGCVPTCFQALMSGGVPCSGESFGDYNQLLVCAGCSDTGNCQGVCGGTLCSHVAPSPDCFKCINDGCHPELHACQNN
jgi:hypothetical protein